MADTVLYKGYSTFEYQKDNSLSINNIELVKIDLLNHIFTRLGTRVMMPEFGSLIPDMVFEPLTDELLDEIYDELEAVFDHDPRVSIISMNVTADYDTNSVYVSAMLDYIEIDTVDEFELNIQFEE